jgi:hypothetical protein
VISTDAVSTDAVSTAVGPVEELEQAAAAAARLVSKALISTLLFSLRARPGRKPPDSFVRRRLGIEVATPDGVAPTRTLLVTGSTTVEPVVDGTVLDMLTTPIMQ